MGAGASAGIVICCFVAAAAILTFAGVHITFQSTPSAGSP